MPDVRYSKNGSTWHDDTPIDWQTDHDLKKLVIGELERSDDKQVKLSKPLPGDLAARFPNLTHLHLWGIQGLIELRAMPSGLRCLDVRGCPDLKRLPDLPATLEELLIESASAELWLPATEHGLPTLYDLSLADCSGIGDELFRQVIALTAASKLQRIDLSGTSVTHLPLASHPAASSHAPNWPERLVDLRLNRCKHLTSLPSHWPDRLRRLECREVTTLKEFPATFPDTLDYLDLREMTGLKCLPDLPNNLRSLLIHGASLNLPPELYGENEDETVAAKVRAHQQQVKQDQDQGLPPALDKEIKVILLGNGYCGKTSLARRLTTGSFDPKEESTHGIRLWTHDLEFRSVDAKKDEPETAQLNIWDFAGQDLYHNTHRLFLQSKAVFLICETDHGKGCDQESDKVKEKESEKLQEPSRDLAYWKNQVRSLGTRPGTNEPPPILYVKTKVDRDGEKRVDLPTQPEQTPWIRMSAESGAGMEELTEQLSLAVAQVLGTREQRTLGSGRKAVRDELQKLKPIPQKNEGRAYITKDEFDALVRSHPATDEDKAKPELLLDLFHQSGFLFYNERFNEEFVILDQRWVIEGIYTIFHRKLSWKNLQASRGQFTLADLRDWVWDEEKYSPKHQQLFLKFMEACGICFEILKKSETPDGQAVYLAPCALPAQEEVADTAKNFRNGLPPKGLPIRLRNDMLGRDAVLQLLVRLGRDWRRAPLLWQWGGQFRSYRESQRSTLPTFVNINWEPMTPASFGGEVTLQQYGPDATFLQAILNELQEIPGFEKVSADIDAGQQEVRKRVARREQENKQEVSLERETAPRPREIKSHKPSEEIAASVRIAISYAGDGQPPKIPWEQIPDTSIEKWPRGLQTELEKLQFHVEDYRTEQSRETHEKAPDRKAYLDTIASQDFMVAFLSRKYLTSKFCMYEFSRVFSRMPNEKLDHARLQIARFPCGRIAEERRIKRTLRIAFFDRIWNFFCKLTNFRAPVGEMKTNSNMPLTESQFRNIWRDRRIDFWEENRLKLQGQQLDEMQLLQHSRVKNDPVYFWFCTTADPDKFEKIIDALNNWTMEDLVMSPSQNELERWCVKIFHNMHSPGALKNCALRLWERNHRGDRDDAMRMYLSAVKQSPDYSEDNPETLLRNEPRHGVENEIVLSLLLKLSKRDDHPGKADPD